jgi:hypothetical protein
VLPLTPVPLPCGPLLAPFVARFASFVTVLLTRFAPFMTALPARFAPLATVVPARFASPMTTFRAGLGSSRRSGLRILPGSRAGLLGLGIRYR